MSEQKLLGREGILAFRASRKFKVVEVEGGSIRVMAPDTRGGLFINKHSGTPESVAAAFVAYAVDENGEPLFPLTEESVTEVMGLPGEVVLAVVNAGNEIGHPQVEEEIKNSPASPASDSPTDSAPISE